MIDKNFYKFMKETKGTMSEHPIFKERTMS